MTHQNTVFLPVTTLVTPYLTVHFRSSKH